MSASTETMTQTQRTSGLPGLHGRLTVLPAAPNDRAEVTENLARLLARAGVDVPTRPSDAAGPERFAATSREAALRRAGSGRRVA